MRVLRFTTAGRSPNGNHDRHFWSHHASGVNFAMGDGHVRSSSCELDNRLFHALATRDEAELIEE